MLAPSMDLYKHFELVPIGRLACHMNYLISQRKGVAGQVGSLMYSYPAFSTDVSLV